MKSIVCFLMVIVVCLTGIDTQAQFVDKGTIIYEVKTNIKKTLGNSTWAEGMKDNLPAFKSSYFKLSFSGNHSQFAFDHFDDKDKLPPFLRQNDEKSFWDHEFDKSTYQINKEVFGTLFTIKDSIQKIKWKLSNENRVICGYNCRKATGIIMDSVYVFAFYTDELTTPGGPATINGLPGMILGLTVPRLYTSYMAQEVKVLDKQPAFISPEIGKKTYNRKEAVEAVKKSTSGWGDPNDPDSMKFVNQLIWNLLL